LLQNDNGMSIEVLDYGCHIRKLTVPNKNKENIDVVIGLDTLHDYVKKNRFFGSVIGRYANRIKNGRFTLDNKEYQLPANNRNNSLHGGVEGFDKKIWKTESLFFDEIENTPFCCGLQFQYHSKHNEEGYPNECNVTVKYLLHRKSNILEIQYTATTDDITIVNLTNHSYFNLNGSFKENDCLNHYLYINSDFITPTDATSIPTGHLLSVVNTPFDFHKKTEEKNDTNDLNDIYHTISERIDDNENEQIQFGSGYDHNYILKHKNEKEKLNENVIEVIGDKSYIRMTVKTTEPGVQLYTSNFLNGEYSGKDHCYYKRSAFCLETQHFPDSPNHKHFPSTILKKKMHHFIQQQCIVLIRFNYYT